MGVWQNAMSVTSSSATLARRIGAAVLAAAWGLVAGATAAAAVGTVRVLVSPGVEIASPGALIVGPILILAEGLFWALLGGAMFVFPLAVVAFACFRPRHTHTAALAISALVLCPIVLVIRSRATDALLLALPVWLGVRVGLRAYSRRVLKMTS